MNSSQVNPGDILKETTPEGYEIGRYLILRRIKEEPASDPWYKKAIKEKDKTIFFVCYVMLVNRGYTSTWSKTANPGDLYHLSAYEINAHHKWEKLFDSPLTWKKIEKNESDKQ